MFIIDYTLRLWIDVFIMWNGVRTKELILRIRLNIMLIEIIQSQKDKLCIFHLYEVLQ